MPIPTSDIQLLLEMITRPPLDLSFPYSEEAATRLQNFIRQKEAALDRAPEGTLIITGPRRGSTTPEYYQKLGERKDYLPKGNEELVRALAQKTYDEKQLREAKRLLSLLGRFAQKDPIFHDALESMSPERRALVDPDFLPDALVRELWKSIKYEGMGFSPNYPEYFTADNVRVRSIGERTIGTRLFERDRLYLYEFPCKLADGGIVYPDFTCLNLRTRKLFLWEHLGRLDEQKYVENNLRKLARYRASGYQLGVDLLVTHEVGGNPLSVKEIDALIDTHLT